MADSYMRVAGGLVHLDIKAVPGASRTEFAGFQGGRLRVRIAAAPEGGKANRELTAFFAGLLGCPRGALILERGEKSRQKTIAFPLGYQLQWDKIAPPEAAP
jgi:uncharacterized protein (TIGR00251 family)